ncbi:MAG TPA: TetR family transcriptional regulator [Pseudonocardiaceae bacterium]|jgi:AcrR family transcriptional regulator
MTSTTIRRMGRRPGSSGSRDAVLDAARVRFAEQGYDGATIRGIAANAGVDPALVHHFFGTKERLFVAAMHLPLEPAKLIPELLAPGLDGLGERLARHFLRLMRELGEANPMIALIRSAAAHPDAARMLREFYTRAVLERLAAELETSRPRLRAALCAAQMIGLGVATFIIGLRPLVEADDETMVAALAPALQHYLTGDLPP